VAAHIAYYEVLGLDSPPPDRKTVKRAYSKMLKVTRPEDDPDGFMRLRDAHDIALNIIAREAEAAAWRAEQELQQEDAHPTQAETSDAQTVSVDPGLTYEDIIQEDATVSGTGYSIGPSPSLDAPVPEPSVAAPDTTDDPKNYNDRENWNKLFREARQLDIDDYVDFEQLLLNKILTFHGYYDDDNAHFDRPEKLPQKFSPSIAASLFKTMSWDQVNKQGYYRGQQIEWLERRMIRRKHTLDTAVPVPQTSSGGTGKIWLILVAVFVLARILLALGDS